jgi:PAS domain S-box-containing protein
MSSETAFSSMTMNLLEQILDQAESPAGMASHLVGRMREIIGCQAAVLLEYHAETPSHPWYHAAVSPGNRQPDTENPIIYQLASAGIAGTPPIILSREDDGPAGELLRRSAWAVAALLPLEFGVTRHGVLVFLDPADRGRAVGLLGSFEPFSHIIALVLKNAIIHRYFEDTIEQRTSQLAGSELRFRILTETVPVGVYQTDLKGDIVYVNNRWCELCGVSALDADGVSWLTAVHPDDRQRVKKDWEMSRQRDLPFSAELRYQHSDGSIIWVLQQAAPVFAESGATSGYIGTVTDITERIQHEQDLTALNQDLERRVVERTSELSRSNEELTRVLEQTKRLQEAIIIKEKLASLTPMVAGVSHELNTPIGNISVLSSALQERFNDYRHRCLDGRENSDSRAFHLYLQQSIEILIKSANSAGNLVQSFKKVVVDRENAQRRQFQLTELVEDCLALVRPSYRHFPWVLVNAVPLDIEIDSYPGALGQVLDNLVRNALIHAFPGRDHGTVTVRATQPAANGEEAIVRIEVSDDGQGIPFRNRHKVFDPFFTTHMSSGSSGLGLSIAYNLVHQMLGGTIRVESRSVLDGDSAETSGTVFTVELPRHRQD